MKTILAVLLSAMTLAAADKPESIEAKTGIHRLESTRRSAFDAFVYVNRIPDKPEDGELPEDYAGRVYGRLANQEGRILLKLPPTMDPNAYFGFKTFLGSEGDVNVANCVSCHSPAGFSDGKSHVVAPGGSPKPTPSLRNLKLRNADLEKVIRAKMAASEARKSGAKDVAAAYARMELTDADVPHLVSFLGTLKDVDDKAFRDLITQAEVFDATQPLPPPVLPPPAASVSGTVRFNGEPPIRKGINMTPESKRMYDKQPLEENVMVGREGGLANVFVYAKRGVPRKDYPLPDEPAVLDQRKSMFRPRLQGVRVGQKLLIRNSDPYIHNTRSLSLRNRAFNIGQPPGTEDRERVFQRPEGPIRLGCDFHKWMAAWVFVLDHPFFAVTDERGRFEINGLPPGEYTLEAWHEELGEQRSTLRIEGAATADFTFRPREQ